MNNMTDSFDELEDDDMTKQKGSGIHKVYSFSPSPFLEYFYSFYMKNNTGTALSCLQENIFETVELHQAWNEEFELPVDYIKREDMKIGDVAKKHVLPFLPAKSLMKFRAVSKEWNHWIVSPLLPYQQSTSFHKLSGYFYQTVDVDCQYNPSFLSLDRSSNGVPSPSLGFLPEKVKVLSSSSGLLLCQGVKNYYVCNPVTEDWRPIPHHQYYHGFDPAVVLAFDPQDNIESYYHIVAAVSLLGQPVVFFEIYSSQSYSWRCFSSDCFELKDTIVIGGGLYYKGMAYWNTTSNDVLALNVKNEVTTVLHVPIPPRRYGALTQIEDELCYVTAYNDCGDAFMLDIYGGVDMRLKHSVCINLGHKKSCQAFEKIPFIDNGTVLCRVLPCFNDADDIIVIYTTERIYLYHLRAQKVETLKSPGKLNPQRRFIPYINSLVMLHEPKN